MAFPFNRIESIRKPSVAMLRSIYFFLNFLIAILLFIMGVIGIAVMDNPYSFLGGLFLVPVAIAVSILEWFAWYRKQQQWEKLLGVGCLATGGFLAFGIVANAVEHFHETWPQEVIWMFGIMAVVGMYFLSCGIYRLSH